MPYKFNGPRRDKIPIPRAHHRVANWPEYDRALQRCGSLTVRVTPEAIAAWCPPRTGQRGRPRNYPEVAIETVHLPRLAFDRPWWQTECLLRSTAALLAQASVCSTTPRFPGVAQGWCSRRRWQVHGAGEWASERHGARGKQTWRKLHLAVDPDGGEILARELVTDEQGGATPGRSVSPRGATDVPSARMGSPYTARLRFDTNTRSSEANSARNFAVSGVAATPLHGR